MSVNSTEIEPPINLVDIQSGWRAVMTGTHWGGEMPEVTDKELECLSPIKPEDNPSFVPSRFMLRLPEDQGGTIVVFSANDVKQWLPPEPTAPSSEPA